MKDKLNFAIVGCGRVSRKHVEALTKHLPAARLVAVCDIQKDRASKVATALSIPAYDSYSQMLQKHPEIDVVNVLTPSGDHAQHVIDIANYSKHIVVEKPMALTVPDAERMVRACESVGVKLFVVKQNRTNPPILKLKEAMAGGRLGKMVMGTVRVRWCRTQEYYNHDNWRGTWAKDGGVLMNQASHHVDLLTWMMGDVESVFAYSATRLVDIETEDTAVAVLKFWNGSLGVIEATTATRPIDLEGSLSILGENGVVEVGGFAVNEMRTWNLANGSADEKAQALALRENPQDVYGFGHVRYLSDVIQSVRTGRSNAVEGIEGMKSLLLINAMYESMETGNEVRLLFRPRKVRLGSSVRPAAVAPSTPGLSVIRRNATK